MPNPFDKIREAIHDTTTKVFGESCSWTPSTGGAAQVAQVNFKNPDKPDDLGSMGMEFEWLAWDTRMEYRVSQFPTLKALVSTNSREIVTINGTDYRVTKVVRVFDGSTFYAKLEAV